LITSWLLNHCEYLDVKDRDISVKLLKEKKMKIYRILATLIFLALLITACGGGPKPAVKSTELNLYAWSEYIPQAILDGFTEQTGVKVNYDTYSSNEELQAKLQAGASGYDVIIPSDYMITILQ
jgi:spermidine/putrescine-binding protein